MCFRRYAHGRKIIKTMKIVLNTSPIIFLSKVEALRLLADVIDEIYAPTAVVNELHEYTPPAFIEVGTAFSNRSGLCSRRFRAAASRRTGSDHSGARNNGRLCRSG